MRGEVFLAVKLRRVNGEPEIDSREIEGAEEWDLKGDAKGGAAHDLMKLIR